MTRIAASAPGKLVVCGEYAVLAGARAICAAIDRRAQVTVSDSEGDHHVVRAPGYSSIDGVFRTGPGEFEWLQGGSGFELFEAVWRRSSPKPGRPVEFVLDTTAFRDPRSGMKIGLGSSAALAVALATALEAIGGSDATSVARAAHRSFQGGLGSGIDIACSQHGGVIEFRRAGPQVSAVDWPGELHFAVLWSRVAADTRAKIGQLNGVDRDFIESADRCAEHIGKGDAGDVVDALRDFSRALRRFDAGSGIGIFAAGHAALSDAAAEYNVVYKPCGAGGGDVGLAVATSAESLSSFCEAASGFGRLDIEVDFKGACLDTKP